MVWHLLQDRAGQGVCTEEGRAGHGADAPAGQIPPGPGKNQPVCGGTWGAPLDPTPPGTAPDPRLPCSPGREGFLKRAADGHCLRLTICRPLSIQRPSLALDSPGIPPV